MFIFYFNNKLNYLSLSNIKNYFSLSYCISLLKQSLPLFISTLAVTIYYNSDVIMLNLFTTVYDVGIYSAYYKIVFVFLTLKAVIIGYFTSSFSQLYKMGKIEKLTKKIFILTRYILSITLLILIVIFFNYTNIITLTFGEKYLVEGSQELLLILLTTVFITYLYLFIPTYHIIAQQQTKFMYFTLIGSISNVLLNFILIPKYGYIGASLSTLGSEIALLIIFFISFKKTMKVRHAESNN